jgi:PST family polysaccharide transporter
MPDAERQRRTVIAGGTAWLTRMVQAAISMGTAIVLARLLTPDAFGVFAMVVPLGVIANQLAGQSFQTALLQRVGLAPDEVRGFFRFAIRANLAIAVLMVLAGFGLAWFFDEPRVRAVAAAWALATWLLTITAFQEAMLKRELRFPVVMLAQLTGLIVGVASAITAALLGAGHWALPLQVLVMETTRAIGVALTSRWVPWHGRSTIHSVASTLDPRPSTLINTWWSLVGFRLSTWINDQPELLAVGRIGGAFTLGLYDTARRWAWYAFEEPYVILTEVAVSGARGSDPAVMRRLLTGAMTATLAVSVPVIGFAGTAADDVVLVLLGSQWLGAIPFLRLLCVAAGAGAMLRVMYWVPLARGMPGVLLRWSLFGQTPLTLLAVLVGIRWGPIGVATAMALAWCAALVPCGYVVLRNSPVGPQDVLGAVWRPLMATAAGIAGVLAWRSATILDGGLERLLIALSIFVVASVAAWLMAPGGFSLVRTLGTTLRPS